MNATDLSEFATASLELVSLLKDRSYRGLNLIIPEGAEIELETLTTNLNHWDFQKSLLSYSAILCDMGTPSNPGAFREDLDSLIQVDTAVSKMQAALQALASHVTVDDLAMTLVDCRGYLQRKIQAVQAAL